MVIRPALKAQEPTQLHSQDTSHFNYSYWNGVADKKHLSPDERAEFIAAQKRAYLESNHSHSFPREEEIIWVTQPLQKKGTGPKSTFGSVCTNIDFENGTLNGWIRKTGFHPLFNVAGCCGTANGAQAIMTGPGTDIYGGFPVVCPGGSFSCRIGNNVNGGIADRIEQSFSVTPQNANFVYRYAVVLNDNGHLQTQQPSFTIEMIDSVTGFQVPCTQYTVAAANNIPGFITSSLTGGSAPAPIVYKPWTAVAIDLTPNIGQIVTIRFTTYDCSLGGHFGYAYVDGFCGAFATTVSDTTCPGVAFTMCGPPGFATYNWNGPGVVNNPNQCIMTSAAGVYTCQTILVPGCPGPDFTHTLNLLPNPVLSFTPATSFPCALQYSFTSTSSISAGSISNYIFSYGNGNSTFLQSSVYNYTAAGNYTPQFKAITDRGCRDSVAIPITIYPFPNLAFSPPSNCINTVVQFTNTSSIPVGSIASYSWNLGNGVLSNSINPTNSYTTNGTYNVTLSATSDQGCVSTSTGTLGIYPPPLLTFTANNKCFGNSTAFSNSTSIASGTIIAYNWDLGDGNTSALANPANTYSAPGNYVVTFSATSNHNCMSVDTRTVVIDPTPTVSFVSNNTCLNTLTNFTNNCVISGSASISSYTWNFGDSSPTSTLFAPGHTYTLAGTYTPTLTALSNSGCPASASGTLTVFPLPQISYSPPNACMNSSISFTNTSSIAAGTITSYVWNFGNGLTTTSINPVYTYTAFGTYQINLQATSDQNCVSTATSNLVIFPLPSISYSTNNLCFGNTTNFTSSVSIATGSILNYSWNFGDGGSAFIPNPSHQYTTSGSFPITFSVTSTDGCVTSQVNTIAINPLPVVSFSANNVCLGNPTNFSDGSTISLGSISTYSWNFGDGSPISSFQNPPHTYTTHGLYTPTLTAISNQNCSASFTSNVQVNAVPIVAFSPPSACVNTAIQFTNTSSIALGTITAYSWDFGNGVTSNLVNPVHTYTTFANYVITLTATSNQGCVSNQTNNLGIYPFPAVSFTPNGNKCLNNQSVFTPNASIPGANSILSYTWNYGDGNISVVNSQSVAIHTYTLHNTYLVSFTARSNQNCVSTVTSNVTVYPNPNALFTSSSFCKLDSTNFLNGSTISTGSISSYLWNFGDNTSGSSSVNPKHKYLASGSYTVSLQANSTPEPTLTCSSNVVNTVIINPLPVLSFTNNSVCAGAVTNFTNTSPTAGIITWFWDFDNNGIPNSGLYNGSFIYPSAGTFTANLVAKNTFNCSDTLRQQVVVLANPTASFSAGAVCLGQVTNFINQTIPGSGTGTTYNWNLGSTSVSGIQNPSYTYTLAGIYQVMLTALSDLGCVSTFTAPVTIHVAPQVNFTANNTCVGKPTQFNNSTGISQGVVTKWRWDFENNGVWDDSTNLQPTTLYPNSGNFTCKLQAFSNNNCEASKTVNFVVRANPVADFLEAKICVGDQVVFTNISTSGDGSLTAYSWDFNGDNYPDNNLQNPSVTYTANGDYKINLLVTSQYGCSDTITKLLTAHPKPYSIFTSDKQSGCPDLCVNFNNLSVIPTGSISSTQWNFGDGSPLATTKNASHCYRTGDYDVSLIQISDMGCRSVLYVPNYINVYSNPVAGFNVNPEEVDEESPSIEVNNTANDINYVRYYINDGTVNLNKDFTHNFKSLDGKTKPFIVQIVKNRYGCADTAKRVLDIKPAFVVYFPNTFTPNGDGINDVFQAKGVGISKFSLQIYDRWGHKVFETKDFFTPWDGTDKSGDEIIKQDVYIWKAQVEDIFRKKHDFVGHVNVIW